MKLIAINLNEGNNREIYWGKSKMYRKEWKALTDDPNNQYDPLTFFKENGKKPMRYEISTIGEPTTIQEKIIERIYSDKSKYEDMFNLCSEDLIESRTSYDELKNYADDMAHFIESLINMI